MRFRKRVEVEDSRVRRRLAGIPTSELTAWAEQSLFSVGKNLADYGRDLDAAHLSEASLGADTLKAVITELRSRVE